VSAKGEKKSVSEQILEILIEKNIISKQQYEELKKQVKEEEAKKPKVTAGYKKGFYIRTTDDQFKIKLEGRFHGDSKFYLGDHPDHASFFVRRARLCVSGTFYKYYDFRVEAEFGKGGSRLNDGFMNVHYWPFAQLKFGQFKTPFSMEELHSDNWIDFVERPLANKLVPSRDLGVMIHGSIQNNFLHYQVGLFNGYKLNQVNDPDGGKDVALRAIFSPFRKSKLKLLRELYVGGALTYGHVGLGKAQWWNSGNFKTAAGTTYLAMGNNVIHDGDRTRKGLEFRWNLGSTALQGEYMIAELDGLRAGALTDDFEIKGGYIYLSYFLTGERFVFKRGKPGRVSPLSPFKPGDPQSGWGAIQIGARYEFLKADKDLLDLGYVDPSQYTDKACGFNCRCELVPQ
jgi:phosphate-selective porin OprO/OprP